MNRGPEGESGAVPVRAVFGLLLVALGVIALGDNVGWFDGRAAFRAFWPLAFVAVGIAVLAQTATRGASRWWGLVWIFAGFWIFADQRDWIELRFWDVFFPAILLLAGGRLVWRSFAAARERPPGAAADGEEYVRSFAMMAGNEIRSVAPGFRGADLTAFMGGVVLDLRQSPIERDEVVVDVFAMWAGIELRVPKEWSVSSRVTPVMGAFEDKTQPTTAAPSRRLVVRGLVVMGGIEVKN